MIWRYESMSIFYLFHGNNVICKCTMWGDEAISLNNFFSCWSYVCIMKTKAICKCTKWINFFSNGRPFIVWKQMWIGGAQCKVVKQTFWTIFSCWFSICIMETKASCKCTMWKCETNSLNYFTLIICVRGRWCVNVPISSMHNINVFFLA